MRIIDPALKQKRRLVISSDDEKEGESGKDLHASSSANKKSRQLFEDKPGNKFCDENSSKGEEVMFKAHDVPQSDEEKSSNPDLYNSESENDIEGEDLAQNWRDDYFADDVLDNYESEGMANEDEEVYTSVGQQIRDRRAAEKEIERRRRKQANFEDDRDAIVERLNEADNRLISEEDNHDINQDEENNEQILNLEAFDCSLREWLVEERTRLEIARRYRLFLRSYYVGITQVNQPHRNRSPPIYTHKIRKMCASNLSSLEVSYAHIGEIQPLLALWLSDMPKEMLIIFNEVLQKEILIDFPHYDNIAKDVQVRLTDLPVLDSIRDLRHSHISNLIRVSGVVTRRSKVFPHLKLITLNCMNCFSQLGPHVAIGLDYCSSRCLGCDTKGSLKINEQKSVYADYQYLNLQEAPGSVPPGRVPRYKEVMLTGDLIDRVRPGELVDIIGIYELKSNILQKTNGFPIFNTTIVANSIIRRFGVASSVLSEADKHMVLELSKDPKIAARIIQSIAPSICGHVNVKTAIALSLFGGCHKEKHDNHRVRGDINILLLGDPGTAKSQMLKFVEKIAPRAVFTTGKGASAVGLTAGVHRDPLSKEWVLEGGALVLADNGVCLIDEFDKMNEQDRTSIHEAMEQQTISVSKAGIVATLKARCAVIAAANPIGGRYDSSFNFAENVELTDPILSRFDILCILQDTVDPIADERLAQFVVTSHMKSHPESDINDFLDVNELDKENEVLQVKQLDQVTLKKYLIYAKHFVNPVINDMEPSKIESLYAELRQQCERSGGIPIAVRHIESIIRMSEASAKMHLREHVRQDDIDTAIKVLLDSFINAQKISVRRPLERYFQKYINFGEHSYQLLMHHIEYLFLCSEKYKKLMSTVSQETSIYINDLENRARELQVFDLQSFFESKLFEDSGLTVDLSKGIIIRIFI